MSTILAVLGGAIVAAAFVAAAALAVPHRAEPGTVPYVTMTLSLATVPVPIALLWTGETTAQVHRFVFVGLTFASVAWLGLAFEYTGRGPTMTRSRTAGLVGYALLTAAGVVLFPLADGPVFAVLSLFNGITQPTLFAAVGYGVFLVARSAVVYDDLRRGDTLVLGVAGGGLTAIWLIRVTTPQLPRQPLQGPQLALLAAVAALFLVGQTRYRVFAHGPSAGHLARETVFDDVSQSVFVTDREDQLVDCNQTALRTFGFERSQMVGRDVGSVIGYDGPLPVDQPVTLNTMRGHRQFEMRQSTLTAGGDDTIGRAYVLSDVTDRRNHEQRLDVLNRVLRHNLRNELDAIAAFAETLEYDASNGDVDAAALATRIAETASDLAALCETVGRTERLLARDSVERNPVDVVAIAHQSVEDLEGQYPDATVTVAAESSPLTVQTDRLLFEAILEEVLENALEHNDEADAQVTVGLETTAAGVRVQVADNGPGIPQRERAVLLDGEETPLRHGSGLGLWLVHWCLTRLGGELDLSENDPRGTIVTLVLPHTTSQPEATART